MDSDTILNYWCDPFTFIQFSGINESDIYSESNPIIFMGGRGSGKTMFLRYWSYAVQKLRAESTTPNNSNIDLINRNQGIGIYIRIDGLVLRSFEGYEVKQETWDSIFTHYFELIVARAYIEVIQDLLANGSISANDVNGKLVPKIRTVFGSKYRSIDCVDKILDVIDSLLDEVTEFRGYAPLRKVTFEPAKIFTSQALSFKIPQLIQDNLKELKGIKFVLLLDEYENFSFHQQRMVNTLLKFVKPHVTFRIGMRLEGFRTFHTATTDDFIKEGRDYRKVVFEEMLIKDKGYQDYLRGVAQKRLEKISPFANKGFTDIGTILTKKENLEEEARELTKNNPRRHFDHFKKHLPADSIEILAYPDNPLLELLNIIWVIRGSQPKKVKQAMHDYLNKQRSENGIKYKRDYVDKYKMSLMFLLASIYHTNKQYYSFNTFCYLSSGIVGHFIELCRQSFQFAEFNNLDLLVNEGLILKEQQDKAAREVATTELQAIQRIEDYGNLLYRFTLNIGNIFSDYHKDHLLRYPETNQFSVDKNTIEGEYSKAVDAALKWSVIQRKSSIQQTSPGKHRKDIYTINRIFSPQFGISCRTRGGVSEEYKAEDIVALMTSEDVKPQKMTKDISTKGESQPTLFGE